MNLREIRSKLDLIEAVRLQNIADKKNLKLHEIKYDITREIDKIWREWINYPNANLNYNIFESDLSVVIYSIRIDMIHYYIRKNDYIRWGEDRDIPHQEKCIISVLQFYDFIKKLEQEIPGLKININLLGEKEEHLYCFEDIQEIYPHNRIIFLDEERKCYDCFDGTDTIIYVSIDGIKHAFWSETAHGSLLSNRAMEGTKEWEDFIEWKNID